MIERAKADRAAEVEFGSDRVAVDVGAEATILDAEARRVLERSDVASDDRAWQDADLSVAHVIALAAGRKGELRADRCSEDAAVFADQANVCRHA